VACRQLRCSEGVDPVAHSDVTAADADVRLVDEEQANLVLHTSNQGVDDERVSLTIAVDGVTVVDRDFYVADQHNWITLPRRLSPGVHEITAESDSGTTLSESFALAGSDDSEEASCCPQCESIF